MTINERIQSSLDTHLAKGNEWPSYLYLGENEATQLDKAEGMLVLSYMNIQVVQVMNRNFLAVGS